MEFDHPKLPPATRYLVTGARGGLGSAVLDHLQALGEAVIGVDQSEADLAQKSVARRLIQSVHPERVIHCAAYTDVEGAEFNAEVCKAVNAEVPGHLARECKKIGASFLHVSTDFVFDGRSDRPYVETDPTGPSGVYAQSKLDGEIAVMRETDRYQIVRSAWLFGPRRRNFVSVILEQLKKGLPAIRVVDDEVGSPTYTRDLAERLIDLFQLEEWGIFHLVNEGSCSRYEQARRVAEAWQQDPDRVLPIKSHERVTSVQRPAYSVLSCAKAYSLGIRPMRHWSEAVDEYVKGEFDPPGRQAARPETPGPASPASD
ncbi:dTDP-4-dehydrorhamnose reductase [Candidatus Sumerlaeota bacterium]|nr:dTDP-4-dehydrorhamnose reductase [Candidatus Sumerlaeota bacterium]